MKKYIAMLLAMVLLLSACAASDGEEDTGRGDGSDTMNDGGSASDDSDMDDLEEPSAYTMTGSVKLVETSMLLVDVDNMGLTYVSFENPIEEEIGVRDYVEISYSGEVMESYPMQANGYEILSVKPYDGEIYYTNEALEALIADGDAVEIVWSDYGDYVAFTKRDLSNTEEESYFVYIASPFMEGDILVDYVEGSVPFISWMMGALQVGTASSMVEHREPFQEIDLDQVTLEDLNDYELIKEQYVDEANETFIEYYQMTGYPGELVQDYINQSLYNVITRYNGMYVGVKIESEILRQDEYLTIQYYGEISEFPKPLELQLTIHVPTATVLTIDNIINPDKMDAFIEMFEEETGIIYAEQEGINVFFLQETIVFTFVPMDDMADRVYEAMTFDALEEYLLLDFEMPAS